MSENIVNLNDDVDATRLPGGKWYLYKHTEEQVSRETYESLEAAIKALEEDRVVWINWG